MTFPCTVNFDPSLFLWSPKSANVLELRPRNTCLPAPTLSFRPTSWLRRVSQCCSIRTQVSKIYLRALPYRKVSLTPSVTPGPSWVPKAASPTLGLLWATLQGPNPRVRNRYFISWPPSSSANFLDRRPFFSWTFGRTQRSCLSTASSPFLPMYTPPMSRYGESWGTYLRMGPRPYFSSLGFTSLRTYLSEESPELISRHMSGALTLRSEGPDAHAQ